MSESVVHIAGQAIQIGSRLRQRCAWCGAVLLDYPLERMAFSIDPASDPRGDLDLPAMWPFDSLVAVDGPASWTVEHEAGTPLPEGCCGKLDPEATARGRAYPRAWRTDTQDGEYGVVVAAGRAASPHWWVLCPAAATLHLDASERYLDDCSTAGCVWVDVHRSAADIIRTRADELSPTLHTTVHQDPAGGKP